MLVRIAKHGHNNCRWIIHYGYYSSVNVSYKSIVKSLTSPDFRLSNWAPLLWAAFFCFRWQEMPKQEEEENSTLNKTEAQNRLRRAQTEHFARADTAIKCRNLPFRVRERVCQSVMSCQAFLHRISPCIHLLAAADVSLCPWVCSKVRPGNWTSPLFPYFLVPLLSETCPAHQGKGSCWGTLAGHTVATATSSTCQSN